MPRLPIDDYYNDDQALADYTARLPVELPQQLVGPNAANAVNNLFAPVGDKPRFQTWPETMIRSGATLPGDVVQGRIPMSLGMRREDYTDIPDIRGPAKFEWTNPLTAIGVGLGLREGAELGPSGQLIERTQDLSGMAGGGALGSKPNATLGSGPVRRAYHGTNKAIDKFEPSKSGEFGPGVYLTDRPDSAEAWAHRTGRGGEGLNIIPTDVDLKNPFTVTKQDWIKMTEDKTPREVQKELQNKGYDGIIGIGINGVDKQIVPFEPHSQIRNAITGQLMSDTSAEAPISALAKPAPIFYSAVENAVRNSKTKTANADQWLGEIRNQPGVKQEELDWVLHELPKGPITKSELEAFVNEHKVELKEVNKQNYTKEQYDEMNKREQELIAKGQNATETEKQEWADIRNKLTTNAEPKYKQWQLPGANNYKEMLLTLPKQKGRIPTFEEWYNKTHIQDLDKVHPKTLEIIKQKYELEKNQMPKEGLFTSSHWSEPNVLAHVRTNERTIPGVGNSSHIEEIQSDFGQAHRKERIKIKEAINKDFDSIADAMVKAGVIKKICD